MLGRHADAFFRKQSRERIVANQPNGSAQSIAFPDRELAGTHKIGYTSGSYENPGPQTVVNANDMLPGMGEVSPAGHLQNDMLPGMGTITPDNNPRDMLPGMGFYANAKDMLPGMGSYSNAKDMLPGMGQLNAFTGILGIAAIGAGLWWLCCREKA